MTRESEKQSHERWAHLRFSVVGPLLASPPARGELRRCLQELSEKTWLHPITGDPTRFGFSTMQRWYYQAKATSDPVGTLRRKVRKDSGKQEALSPSLIQVLVAQRREHPTWSYQLHADNLAAQIQRDSDLGKMPSYSSVLRSLKSRGLAKVRSCSKPTTEGKRRAVARLEQREVRSFEAEHVLGLWHLDFHHGSLPVVTPGGEWITPVVLGVLDDRSRLACHVQWYLEETAETLIHALGQAFLKRGLPRSLMSDNGSPMIAAETTEGLARLSVVHERTLPHSPYQNGKQESFWGMLEGRLMAMLESCEEVTLSLLNEATQAWVEMEYNRKRHSEIGQSPVARYLEGPDVGRSSPSGPELRLLFTAEFERTQRHSDGTISIQGRRFEIPSRFRHLSRVKVRYARWDLSYVHLVDRRTATVLCRLYPQDKTKNADGRRRALAPVSGTLQEGSETEPAPKTGVAPLLRQLMADYAATGLPPAYLVKKSLPETQQTENPPPTPPTETASVENDSEENES